ncbi:MAG: DUF87 domain-containing protein [Candidatus Aenigmarchaeota archaeon]|nr:DUF87 domain-containing protein [Candidatus Aenigmarchaeota archaeon]MDW8149318.1 DUF87 domain-containing protein [Candidatus Aenigmarchaeota archaeon]
MIRKYVIATWRNPEYTINSTNISLEISVSSNPLVLLDKNVIIKNIEHDKTTFIDTLTTISFGNDEIRDVKLITVGGNLFTDCPECILYIVPNDFGVMQAGANQTSSISIRVPFGQPPGIYWTKIRANTSNAGYYEALLNLTLLTNGSWVIVPENLGTVLIPPGISGNLSRINITNIGNIHLAFQILKSGNASSFIKVYPEESREASSFELEKRAVRSLVVEYSIPKDTIEGIYVVDIIIRNLSFAMPAQRVVPLIINVSDIPPTISNVSINPINFEVDFDIVNVSAIITDNLAVDKAWLNLTYPNGTSIIIFMNKSYNNFYYTNFSSNQTGKHSLLICANDTRGLVNCLSYEAIGWKSTFVEIVVNDLIADNVTIVNNQTILFNITLNNIGYSRALNVSLSMFSYSTNITFERSLLTYGTILKNSSKLNSTNLIIYPYTLPGNYTINLTVTWINLDLTTNSTSKNVTIIVLENPLVIAKDAIVERTILAGSYDVFNQTILSIGNVNVTNISIVCVEGIVCNNFTTIIDPVNISLLKVGEVVNVSINISVPSNFLTGIYNGTFAIYYNQKNSTFIVKVRIPLNISWEQYPLFIENYTTDGTTGVLAKIKLINTGNGDVPLDLLLLGNASQYLYLLNKSIILPFASSIEVPIFYKLPYFEKDEDLIGILVIRVNESLIQNATIAEINTTILLHVLQYSVKIVNPTEKSPLKNVLPTQNISALVNVTRNGTSITDNLSFTIILSNFTFSIEINNVTHSREGLLNRLFFLAPNISLNRVYDLEIIANFSHPNLTLSRRSIEREAIIYRDNVAPLINILLPPRLPINETLFIFFNITEAGGLNFSTIRVVITKPDNSTEELAFSFVSRIFDVYIFNSTFSNTSLLGSYSVRVEACDKTGNCNFALRVVEIYPVIRFSGYMRDYESIGEIPINAYYIFRDPLTDLIIFNFSVFDFYNETIDARRYDMLLEIRNGSFNNIIKIKNISLVTNLFNPIIVGNVPKTRTTLTQLKGIYIDTILNATNYSLIFSFADCENMGCGIPIYDPRNLGIYKYLGNWTPKISSSINMLWTRVANIDRGNIDGSVNLSTRTIEAKLNDIRGVYILAEFICGDGVCESEFGESNSICPFDCITPPPSPPAPPTPPAPPGIPGVPGIGIGIGPNITLPNITINITGNITPITRAPIEFRGEFIDIEIYPQEEKILSVDILNHFDMYVDVAVTIEGPAANLVTVLNPFVRIAPLSSGLTRLKAFAPVTLAPGIYTGDIVLFGANITHRIPINVKLKPVLEPLLDVKVKALTKVVEPGRNLIFEVTLINMGQTPKIEDITAYYRVRTLNPPYRIIAETSETVAVVNTITYRREIQIPEDTRLDDYLIEVNASYWYGVKYAIASDSFTVSTLPAPLVMLRSVMTNWITWLILLIGTPIFFAFSRWYAAYRMAKLAKKRYIAPIDFKALPQPGPDSIEVGKIAESDVKAYIDMKQLLMHTIAAGGTGSGKTVSAMVVAEELLKRKIPVIVVDPTAQWTGFIKPNRLKVMLDLYPKFGLKPTDARSFKTNIIVVEDPEMQIDLKKWMIPGEITVFVTNRLKPEQMDMFTRRMIQAVFDMRPAETKEVKLLLVFDEVHRLLPKYGGKGGYVAIERGCREFRKWGIGIFLISQVLLDFKAAVRANIASEIQLRTRFEGDINRVKTKYGQDYANKVVKLTIGTGLFQNPEYNHGKPWFIEFRPLLHSPLGLTDAEINEYVKIHKKLEEIENVIKSLKEKGKDTYDLEIELNIAKDKLKTGAFVMANTYIESLEKRLEKEKI